MLRTKELDLLEKIYQDKKSSLSLVFGQTGIGKTEFIKEFVEQKISYI